MSFKDTDFVVLFSISIKARLFCPSHDIYFCSCCRPLGQISKPTSQKSSTTSGTEQQKSQFELSADASLANRAICVNQRSNVVPCKGGGSARLSPARPGPARHGDGATRIDSKDLEAFRPAAFVE